MCQSRGEDHLVIHNNQWRQDQWEIHIKQMGERSVRNTWQSGGNKIREWYMTIKGRQNQWVIHENQGGTSSVSDTWQSGETRSMSDTQRHNNEGVRNTWQLRGDEFNE